MNREMRRKDREISEEESRELLKVSEYGILATTNQDGTPYATPLNYVMEDKSIYFHCALVGSKLDNIKKNPDVCFTVVGETKPIVDGKSYSAIYESVVVFGKAKILDDDAKRKHILHILTKKYFPENMDAFENSLEGGAFERTAIVEIAIEHMTGKGRKA